MNPSIRFFGLVAALAFASAAPVSAQAAGQTAKAPLPKAIASAKAWQPDAILVHLSTVKLQSDGTATEWLYSFYSPKSGKRCVVTARGGSVTLKEVRLGAYTEPLGEFIDSDKAMEAAKKNGLKGSEPFAGVGRPTGGQADSTYWIVTGGWAKGDVTVSLDAKTGKFMHSEVMDGK
jgi:hypothetical protein